jgi:hypothetical protein
VGLPNDVVLRSIQGSLCTATMFLQPRRQNQSCRVGELHELLTKQFCIYNPADSYCCQYLLPIILLASYLWGENTKELSLAMLHGICINVGHYTKRFDVWLHQCQQSGFSSHTPWGSGEIRASGKEASGK